VEYWAQYGPTASYGSETTHQTVSVAKNTLRTVYVTISGLQRATTYHYRLCSRDSQQQGGPGCGDDKTVTTQTYGCGETVTTSFKLTGNLNCLQQPGFVVGASGLDINLAGHLMYGGITSGGGGPIAIDNSGGYDDVTVRNGTINNFGYGVATRDADRNHILHINTTDAGDAITIAGGRGIEIRHGALFGRTSGIRVDHSDGLVVADTSSEGVFGDGVEATGDLARIVRNRFVRSNGEFPVASGVHLIGSGARIADNLVQGRWSAGIVVWGTSNTLVDNQVFGAAKPDIPNPPPELGDGIFVGVLSSGVVLRGNTSEDNAGDGIDVRASGASLESNQAFGNGGWGILAVPGVTDLGGNAGGGSAGDCQNVFCP
jgi:Right handed beta helix region